MKNIKFKNPKASVIIKGARYNNSNIDDTIAKAFINQNPNNIRIFEYDSEDKATIELNEAVKELQEARDAYESLTGRKAGRRSLETLLKEIEEYKPNE